jgi:hypothetical protein
MRLYVADLAAAGTVSAKNWKQYLSPVNTLHTDLGLQAPCIDAYMRNMITGGCLLAPEIANNRGFLPSAVVAQVVQLGLKPSTSGALLRDCAVLVLSFLFVLRGATVRELTVSDVSVVGTTLHLSVWAEKTRHAKRERRGLQLQLPDAPEVVELVEKWLSARRAQNTRKEGLWFLPKGREVAQDLLDNAVKTVVGVLLLTPPAGEVWSGHSCRKGGATAMFSLGVSMPAILHVGGWASAATAKPYIDCTVVADKAAYMLLHGMLPIGIRLQAKQYLV